MGRSNFLESLGKLFRDKRGTTMVTFGVALVPLVTAMGAAVDYTSAATRRTRLLAAADAAAIRGCKDIQAFTVAQAKTNMQNTFVAMFPYNATMSPIVNTTVAAGTVKITATSLYEVTLGALVGLHNVTLHATSECEYSNNTYEVALVMDNSGSMSESAGAKTKIQGSIDAAKSLVDSLYSGPTSTQRVKMSVVPFTLSVTVGSQYRTAPWADSTGQSSRHWDNFDYYNSTWKPVSRFDLFTELNTTFGGCFETRPGNYATTDVGATVGAPDSYFVPQFAPDDPGPRSSSSNTINGYTYENSYLDDNTSGTGLCSGYSNTTAQIDKALTKLCKYRGNPTKNVSNSRGPNYMCNGQPLQRMINDPVAIKAKINTMVANGNTNIFEGFMWGWRTISPNGPFNDGRVYGQQPAGQANNVKVMIVLTDGINAWQGLSNPSKSRYSPGGFLQNTTSNASGYHKVSRFTPTSTTTEAEGIAAMDARLQTACANAKAMGVIVYTIGFAQLPTDVNETVLRNCASPNPADGTPQYYYAANSAQVDAVFKDIANRLSQLRLTL